MPCVSLVSPMLQPFDFYTSLARWRTVFNHCPILFRLLEALKLAFTEIQA